MDDEPLDFNTASTSVTLSVPAKLHRLARQQPQPAQRLVSHLGEVVRPFVLRTTLEGPVRERVAVNIPALYVEGHIQPPYVLLLLDKRPTTLADDVWDQTLADCGLSVQYRNLLAGLQSGFNLDMPLISRTFAPPNHPSLRNQEELFTDWLADESRKGRIVGLIRGAAVESCLGPFQSSPVSIVPKSTPGKYRIIQNFSYPPTNEAKSVNSAIVASLFPATYASFREICEVVAALPAGEQGCVRDVSEAFRRLMLARSQV